MQLERGYSALNWAYIIDHYYNPEDSFDFKISWKNHNRILGAFISSYKVKQQCLEIYAIENFDRQDFKQMLLLSLSVAYLLMSKVGGILIKLVDVEENETLLKHYQDFGFYPDPKDPTSLIISIEQLSHII